MAVRGARPYRPKFHYTPEKGWINDPNGLVCSGGLYHLFAQHNPDDTKWGPMHWAHAVSDDLLHWRHLPIALRPDGLGMCFSGSAALVDGRIGLIYTSHGAHEQQSVAFSEDGRTLTYHVTLEEDKYSIYADKADVLIAKAGYYTVTIDVLSGSQTVDHVPLEPREGRWDDVPADAWYLPAAEFCADWGLIADAEKRRFDPAGEITVAQMVETAAHVHSYLTTGDWSLPLRPADWGNAVFRLEDGREIDGFRAWERKQWRTWSGPMNKESWHYSIRSTRDELLDLFPELAEESPVWLDATLDMGDKQVSGRLEATLEGDFEEGGPALLFYPAETSGYQSADLLEPGYPTQLFLCAQPGNEGSCRGLYYMAEKGIWHETGPYRTAYAWELAWFLYDLWLFGSLPEETFRPIYDVTVPEGTSYGTYLEPLYRAGILRPDDPDWAFDPEAPVTRAQFAVVLYRLLEPSAR